MDQLAPVNRANEVFPQYRNTPISRMLEFHNLEAPLQSTGKAELLIGMCMDFRKALRLPPNFAYIIRTGGANLRYVEFQVSFSIAVGGIRHIALIGHNHCGMVNLAGNKAQFIKGLVNNAGWEQQRAEAHFYHFAPMFETDNEIDFILSETQRLRLRYPKVTVAPLLYKLEDNRLYLIKE